MILVNVRRSARDAVTPEQLRDAARGDWANLTDESIDEYGDLLLAVKHNKVVGAWSIASAERLDDDRIRFELRDDPELEVWVGADSPVQWKRGQANPVALIDTDDADSRRPSTSSSRRAPASQRRRTHRITIETKDLGDEEAARLHHVLLTTAMASGTVTNYRSTSLVREMKAAQEALSYDYQSAPSPPGLKS